MKNFQLATLIGAMMAALNVTVVAQEKPANPTKAIKDYFENVLKDPDSAKYKFGEMFVMACHPTSDPDNLAINRPPEGDHWAQKLELNAKNSMGGYTGYQETVVIFDGQHVIYHQEADSDLVLGGVIRAMTGCVSPSLPNSL